MKGGENLKILLIQIRRDAMKEHEYECFLRYGGLSAKELISHDVFKEETNILKLRGYDAVIMGGSGEYSVLDEKVKDINEKLKEIIRFCYDNNFPFLGACYGGQLAALAMGGSVAHRAEYAETGSFEIFTTTEAKNDPLFKFLPEKFYAQLGHKDSIVHLPEGAILLARSKKCPVHAFTFPGKKFYATQFHAELGKVDLLKRINYYKSYTKDKEELEKVIATAKDSPEAATLPRRFIDAVVLKDEA